MRSEFLASIAKDFGVIRLAKFLVDEGAHGVSENELTALILDHAIKTKRAGETDHMAFARVYSANDDEGLLLRKAVAVTKARPAPTSTNTAYEQLMKLAEAQRKLTPDMSIEKAFAKVYDDNKELAAQERSENQPHA